MQRYFREKEQSANSESTPVSSLQIRINQSAECSSDVYGKVLENFERRSGTGEQDNEVPLLFYLLTGYFRANQERMQKMGLFRITASDSKVKELELHLSQGNYGYLESAEVHVVANYLKRVLGQMYAPLINQEVLDKLC